MGVNVGEGFIHPIDADRNAVKAHVRTKLAIVVYNWRIYVPYSPSIIDYIVLVLESVEIALPLLH